MSRRFDRRAAFFLVAAIACLLTLLITPPEYYWLGIGLAVVYLVLALVSHLDFRSRIKER